MDALVQMTDWETQWKVGVCGRIREARLAAGFTSRRAFALRLGVDEGTYKNYEKMRVPWDLLDQIAEELGTTVDYLLYGHEPVPLEFSQIEQEMRELLRRLQGLDRTSDSDEGAPSDPR